MKIISARKSTAVAIDHGLSIQLCSFFPLEPNQVEIKRKLKPVKIAIRSLDVPESEQ